jgi:ABC-2 type transport system permease protein
MDNQPPAQSATPSAPMTAVRRFAAEPGVATITSTNWSGMRSLYVKEVRRFFKVQLQTVWAPAITTLLYLVIFTVSLGSVRTDVLGVPFIQFLAPGLIAMAMLQASFANASFSLLVGKIQGTIIDYLMPPLSEGELLAGLVGASVTRALLVGGAIWLVMAVFGVPVGVSHPWAVVAFGVLGAAMLGFLGVLTSIWAEKFDHAALISNFVVAPLSLLSGTFYTVDRLVPAFQTVSHANPFFYAISGFRYGYIGVSDSPVWVGVAVLTGVNVVLCSCCYLLLRSGWKTKS